MSTHICPICLEEHTHSIPGEDGFGEPENPAPVDPAIEEPTWKRGTEWLEQTESGWVPVPVDIQPEIQIEMVQTLSEPWPEGLFKLDGQGNYWRWNGESWETAESLIPKNEEEQIPELIIQPEG